MTNYDWIKKTYQTEIKRPVKLNQKVDRDPTMSIDELRELRRSRYYQHRDLDLTDRLVELRVKRDNKHYDDHDSHKSHKDDRDRIMDDVGSVLVDSVLVKDKDTKTTKDLYGL